MRTTYFHASFKRRFRLEPQLVALRRTCLWTALVCFATALFVAQTTRAAVIEAWVQRYNGPGNHYDRAHALTVDSSGNVVVTGVSANGAANGFNGDYYTAKYSATNGGLLWEQSYNDPANGYDIANAVAVDSSGNVVVTGYSWGGGSEDDFYTAKYSATDGTLLWEQRYNGSGNHNDGGTAVAVDTQGNVVVTGYCSDYSGIDNCTVKYAAATGAVVWERRYTGPGNSYSYPGAVEVDVNGNVIVTGNFRYRTNAAYSGYYTVKYAAATGLVLWEQHYEGPYASQAMALDGSGNVFVAGYSYNGTNHDCYTAKYAAADGALLWEQHYNGRANSHDAINAVAVNRDGDVFVTGYSYKRADNQDYYTAKYAGADGALLWEHRYNGSADGNDQASALAIDNAGNVIVTGSSWNGRNYDYYTVKYAAADGALFWEQRYSSTEGFESVAAPHGVALGPNGVVAVTGSSMAGSWCCGSNFDYLTVVYRELSARGAKENVLGELTALRATVTARNDRRKLDEAITHLTKSLAPKLWVDETHVDPKHGTRVFHQENLTVRKLCHLIRSRTSDIPDTVLQGFIDQIFQADHDLAAVAIQDAITAGVSSERIEQAQRFLARGDAAAGDDKCSNGIGYYRNAWKRVTR